MDRDDDTVLYSLQIGRALAAIGVIIYHSALAVRSAYPFIPDTYFKLFSLGHFGVDYFFVLSGFIIAHAARSIPRDAAGAKRYFTNRFIRVYVPYLPISLVMIAVLSFMPNVSMGERAQFSLFASLFLVPSDVGPALYVAWTLQHEVVFYVLFGLCLFVFKRPKLIFLWALPMIYLLFIEVPHWLRILSDILNIEFLFGVAACYLYHNRALFVVRKSLIAFGLTLVLASFYIMFSINHFEHYRVITGFGYALITLGCVYMEREIDFKRFTTLIYFGAISYAIYLIHGPVISVLLRYATKPHEHWFLALLVFSLASCVAGAAYFRLVEKPLLAFAKRRFAFKHISA